MTAGARSGLWYAQGQSHASGSRRPGADRHGHGEHARTDAFVERTTRVASGPSGSTVEAIVSWEARPALDRRAESVPITAEGVHGRELPL